MTVAAHDLCKECGGKCCRHHPHIFDTEMQRIIGIRPDLAGRFTHVFGRWYKFVDPCPLFDEETGCTIERYEDRPIICRLFPFCPVPCSDGWVLPMYVSECEHWRHFGEQYKEAEEMFVAWLRENDVPAVTKEA